MQGVICLHRNRSARVAFVVRFWQQRLGVFQPSAVLFNNKRPDPVTGGGVLLAENLLDDKNQIMAGMGSLIPGGIGVLPGMPGLLGGSLIGVGAS